MKDNVTPLRPKRPCPECGKPSAREAFPFCSPRCKDIDLNRWLSGRYAIPATEEDENAGAAESMQGASRGHPEDKR